MFQITGGVMMETSPHHALLVFGQDFESAGITSDGTYSMQVRRFRINDNRKASFLCRPDGRAPDRRIPTIDART